MAVLCAMAVRCATLLCLPLLTCLDSSSSIASLAISFAIFSSRAFAVLSSLLERSASAIAIVASRRLTTAPVSMGGGEEEVVSGW